MEIKTIFVVFSVLLVIVLIYYFFVNDLIKNKGQKKTISKEPRQVYIAPKNKGNIKSESYSNSYSLYEGDVKLTIRKEEANFIKTIIRSHRIIKPDSIPERKDKVEVTPTKKPPAESEEMDYNGSAFDSYEANLDHILASNVTESEAVHPNLEDIKIVKGEIPNKNPVSVADIIRNQLENPLEIEKIIDVEMLEMRRNSMLINDKETTESEILEEFINNCEIFSDNKENIPNFNPDKSDSEKQPKDNHLEFENLEFDETL